MMEVHFGLIFLLISLFLLGFLKYLMKNYNCFKIRGIVYLKPLLFFGNYVDAFLELENHEKFLRVLYEYFKTEKIFGIFYFLRPIIIIKDLNVAKQITNNHHEKFLNRDSFDVDAVLNMSLFNLRGDSWRDMRCLIEKYFLAENFKNWHHNQIDFNSKLLIDNIKHDMRAERNDNLKRNFELSLVNVFCDILLGCKSLKCDKVYMCNILKQVEKDLTSTTGKLKIIFLTHFPGFSRFLQIKVIKPSVYEFIKDFINQETICKCDDDKISLLDFMLKKYEENLSKNNFLKNKDMLVTQVFSLFIDGFFLISKLFQACCYELGTNEKFQNQLREALVDHKSSDGSKLLQNFVLETLRTHSPIKSINRICNQNCTIECKNGEKLKFYSGDFIKIPIALLNNDYKYFDDPLSFNIDRFHKRNEPILSFGLGARYCFCSDFALFQIKSTLFEIMSNFQIITSADELKEKLLCDIILKDL